jgi:serine/threonine protein kinase
MVTCNTPPPQQNDWKIPAPHICRDIGAVLGAGSFGTVYLAEWRRTRVAVKCIDAAHSSVALFEREFDVMTRMHHPNIVQLLGYLDDPFAIVMEYLPGGSLAERRQMTNRTKQRVCLDVLRGLGYMHNRTPHKCIHRDIKPRNILFTPSGMAKIADLGLSKLVRQGGSATNLAAFTMSHDVGTERYAAPEAKGTGYDTKVDIYSCGVVFYEMFEEARLATADLEWAAAPTTVRGVISRMTRSDPVRRPDALDAYDEIHQLRFSRWWSGGWSVR